MNFLSQSALINTKRNESINKKEMFLSRYLLKLTIFHNIHKLEIYAQINSGCTLTARENTISGEQPKYPKRWYRILGTFLNNQSESAKYIQLSDFWLAEKIPNEGYSFIILAVTSQFCAKTSKHYLRHISVIKNKYAFYNYNLNFTEKYILLCIKNDV